MADRSHVAGTYRTGRCVFDGIVDEIAVERAASGDRSISLNVPERRAAITLLRHRGKSYKQIARVLGMSDRSVARHLAQLRTEGAAA